MPTKPMTEANTEEKIKRAARRIFIEKGYAATRTRDIAGEANINLSMLNYYFRSKENLFETVMVESFASFIAGLKENLDDRATSLEDKITAFASNYIDLMLEEPGLYLFLVNEIRHNPSLLHRLSLSQAIKQTYFMQQLTEAMARNPLYAHMEPTQFILNVYALTIFPFATNYIFLVQGEEKVSFHNQVLERKAWIARWVKAMLEMGEGSLNV
ncbi:TetR/AcrR family transcriptional regulator [Deminuibacter soli]|nr:TetR/AcrR family transcriptional regulator [Deminuibacter soli]